MAEKVFDTMNPDSLPTITTSPLYIYRRSTILCFEQCHDVVDVIATYPSINNITIKLPAQYCINCDKLLISEEEFNRHQKMLRYRFIPARIHRIGDTTHYNPTNNHYMNREKESPLKLCGYFVGETGAIPREIRQNILRFVIEKGILSKLEVIHYLELFINTNGRKRDMEPSVQRWKDDLHFVYLQDFHVVAKARVTAIIPYRR